MTVGAGTGDGMVQIAYLHNEHVSHSWHECCRSMRDYDLQLAVAACADLARCIEHGYHVARRPLNLRCGSGIVAHVRNYAARLFLDKTDHEWLLCIDTDMGWPVDAVERLLEAADPVERPVVGALCFAAMEAAYDGMGGWRRTIVPTMYKIGKTSADDPDPSFCYYGPYEPDTVTPVAGTGGAFLLIHRSALEKVRADVGDHWFDMMYDRQGDIVGEDFAFCGRLHQVGITPYVHTGVKTTHHKEVWLSELDYIMQEATILQPPPPAVDTYVDVAASLAILGEHVPEQVAAGAQPWKIQADLDRYAAVIAATRPDVVVETGTKWGGSARWFESQGVDVITVDIDPGPVAQETRDACPRTTFIVGSSLDPAVVEQVRAKVAGRRVMVSLDSDHSAPHVAAEIAAYGPMVSPGCYLVVEDGVFDLAEMSDMAQGGSAIPHVGGPLRAIVAALVDNPNWERDEEVERMSPVSTDPAGWWIRRG